MNDEYHRPSTIREALILLAREHPPSYPLGGGTVINRGTDRHITVVDLQALGLGTITRTGYHLNIGATVTLQDLLDFEGLPEDLYKGIMQEATYNLRQMATMAGTIVTAEGRSPLATIMLALDASIEVRQLDITPQMVKIGDWLPMREALKPGKLITMVKIPLNIQIAYEYIARTPADQPIVCTTVAQWESGRTRLALGGWGKSPILAMDGPTSNGIKIAAQSAYSHSEDEWASAEYRQEMAGVLAERCLRRINPG